MELPTVSEVLILVSDSEAQGNQNSYALRGKPKLHSVKSGQKPRRDLKRCDFGNNEPYLYLRTSQNRSDGRKGSSRKMVCYAQCSKPNNRNVIMDARCGQFCLWFAFYTSLRCLYQGEWVCRCFHSAICEVLTICKSAFGPSFNAPQ